MHSLSPVMDLSPVLSPLLYCAENADDVESWKAGGEDTADEWASDFDPIAGDIALHFLLEAETQHMPCADYLSRFRSLSLDATARQDSINWILKVTNFYHFRPTTAYLSVNYLDRFLSSNPLPVGQEQNGQRRCGGGWPMQLLSVACLSIAAKMEETHVPLLLDLQILDPKYVFEPRTIRRMELFLMSALRWRMRAVTPFDFLPHFAASIISGDGAARTTLFSRAADLIISTHRVVDFLGFRPSAIAATAVLCAAAEIAGPSAAGEADDCFSRFTEWVMKEVLRECSQLMEQYLIDTCPSARGAASSIVPPTPPSPVGVLDAAACGSCDTHKSSAAGVIHAEPPPPPPEKRRRLAENQQCTESIFYRR